MTRSTLPDRSPLPHGAHLQVDDHEGLRPIARHVRVPASGCQGDGCRYQPELHPARFPGRQPNKGKPRVHRVEEDGAGTVGRDGEALSARRNLYDARPEEECGRIDGQKHADAREHMERRSVGAEGEGDGGALGQGREADLGVAGHERTPRGVGVPGPDVTHPATPFPRRPMRAAEVESL